MNDFYKNNYKKMMFVPILLLIPILIMIFIFPGIHQGIDFSGGSALLIYSEKPIDAEQTEILLSEKFNLSDVSITTTSSPTSFGARIKYNDNIEAEAEELLSLAEANLENTEESIKYSVATLELLKNESKNYENAKVALKDAQNALVNYNEKFSSQIQNLLQEELDLGEGVGFQSIKISPTLGQASLESMGFIAIIGMILIIFIIFIAFRQIVPSLAIIQAMAFDVVAGLAGMALLNIPLSLTTMPALLMLIGYSVDTDIMLTSKMLKEKGGTPGERATSSMKTGLTMTGTTLAALIAMIIISYFYQVEVIYYISAILLFGLIGDVIATWLMNAPILIWFIEGKK